MHDPLNNQRSFPAPNAQMQATPDYQCMLAFVRASGGRVRFDDFAKEHLTGERGFYSKKLDIKRQRDEVSTPSALELNYRSLLVASVALYVADHSEGRPEKFKNRPITFCEIGGGAGEFKTEFIGFWSVISRAHGLPDLEYISVDINPKHRAYQAESPGRVIAGSAIDTNLPDNSLDVLFDEELLDCLPFRIFSWDPSKKIITHEAYVQDKNGILILEHVPMDSLDNLAMHTQTDLETCNYPFPIYRYAPSQWDYLLEANRVLRPGGLKMSGDYDCYSTASFMATNLGDVEKALSMPYSVDLTHGVDFSRFSHMANLHRIPGRLLPFSELFSEIKNDQHSHIEGMMRTMFIGIKR